MIQLDHKDLALLEALQDDARRRLEDLAREVGLSVSAVGARIRRFRESGLIRREVAILDRALLGIGTLAFVRVLVDSADLEAKSVALMTEMAQVLECHRITGEYSYLLKVAVPDIEGLEDLLARIKSVPGVSRCDTLVSLSVNKERTSLTLPRELAKGKR